MKVQPEFKPTKKQKILIDILCLTTVVLVISLAVAFMFSPIPADGVEKAYAADPQGLANAAAVMAQLPDGAYFYDAEGQFNTQLTEQQQEAAYKLIGLFRYDGLIAVENGTVSVSWVYEQPFAAQGMDILIFGQPTEGAQKLADGVYTMRVNG